MLFQNFVKTVIVLSLPHRIDRQLLVNKSFSKSSFTDVNLHYTWGKLCEANGEACAMNGWLNMFRNSVRINDFPTLFVEDDIDFTEHSNIPQLPQNWSIISIASVHHNPLKCQGYKKSTLVEPDSWRNWGNAAILVRSKKAVKDLLQELTKPKYTRHKTLDMKLFATKYKSVLIVCPPILHWTSSYSDVLKKHRNKTVP